jgi:ankyrin repeat protein
VETHPSFFEAVKAGDQARVAALLEHTPSLIGARSESGTSAVLLAAYYGHPALAGWLAERSPRLDIFEAAAAGRRDRVAERLAEQPALANAYAADGFHPLGLAAFFGHVEVVEFLLGQGAGVNSPSNNAQRVMPLHSAAAGAHLAIARRLLDHGAEVNAVQAGGFVPLHSAAQNGQVEMVSLLLAHGAEVNARTHDGRTALNFALEGGHTAVVEVLRQHGAA